MYTIREVIESEITGAKRNNLLKIMWLLFKSPSKKAVFYYRVATILYNKKLRVLAIFLRNKLVKDFGLHISLSAKIELGLQLRHANGVVIGDGVEIGKNAIIYHQVTIGGQNLGDGNKNNYPLIGDNVTVFAGAKILGKIKISDNCIIGANSVIIRSTEPNSVYAGVPGKKIGEV
jgi:serine O-acetyltransferase